MPEEASQMSERAERLSLLALNGVYRVCRWFAAIIRTSASDSGMCGLQACQYGAPAWTGK
jgi:hypothetical protein